MVLRLTVPEKVLVHLYTYRKYVDRYDYPMEMTQQGIAQAVGISVTHIPRNLKKLMEEGLVKMKKGHVTGKKKRVAVYFLTPSGIAEATKLIEEICNTEIKIGKEYLKICEIRKVTGLPYMDILKRLEKGDIENVLHTGERIIFREVEADIRDFVGRERELKLLQEGYEKGTHLVIIGSRGTGKSSLVEKFLSINPITDGILWFDVYPGRTWNSVKAILKNLFGEEDILHILRRNKILIIFDGYHRVDDEFVNALNSLIQEDLGDSHLIITMLPETPYYNRFYTLKDVSKGRVLEVRLGNLSYEETRYLFPKVREDAFKRIYQITQGNPRLLVLLKRGELEETNLLNPEVVHLLNYLVTVREE